MKFALRSSVTFLLALTLLWVVGCDDDDDDNPVNPNPEPTMVSGADLTAAERTEVVENGFLEHIEIMMQVADQTRASFNGQVVVSEPVADPVSAKDRGDELSAPLPDWFGEEPGTYVYLGDGGRFDVYRVQLTPDIWAEEHADEPLERIGFYYEDATLSGALASNVKVNYFSEINDAHTEINGELHGEAEGTVDPDGTNVGVDYSWDYTWEGVLLDPDSGKGDFSVAALYPLVRGDTDAVLAQLNMDLSLDENGEGTATGTLAGDEMVRAVFEGFDDNGDLIGHYQLATQEYGQDYPFALQASYP